MTREPELLRDLNRPTGWVLLVEGVEQSYVDVADPTHLEFEYMQHMGVVLDVVRPRPEPISVVHLGAGAGSMARWVSATRPGSTHVLVDHSTAVVDRVASLGLPADAELVLGDARDVLDRLPTAAYDVVLWDLYDGPRAVTTALTSEALHAMGERLRRDSGVLVLNVSDKGPFEVVRPVLAALRALFTDVALLAEPSTLRGRRSGNCVLVATRGSSLPAQPLVRAGAGCPVRASVVIDAELTEFVGAASVPTDAAPLPPPDPRKGRAFL